MNAAVQLVNGERNKREIAVQSREKQLQGVRDQIENLHSVRRQDIDAQATALQEMRNQFDSEKSAREAFEDRMAFDIHTMGERIDTSSRHHSDMLQDQVAAFRRSVEEMNTMVQQNSRQVHAVRTDVEATLADLNKRFGMVEDK